MERVLDQAQRYLDEHVRPKAVAIDREPSALLEALNGLRQRQLMALRRPLKFGGPELSDNDYQRFQVMLARRSGALAFLVQQHQSAVKMIAAGHNETLKASTLPHMDGERLMGIGYSQLRRSGPPMLRAAPARAGGYRLDGVVPWVTGAEFYPEVLIGAELPDGRAVFGVVPFEDRENNGATIRVGPPMELASLAVARTCQVTLDRWPLADRHVARVEDKGWMQARDAERVADKSWLILGCARGAADVLARASPVAGQTMHAMVDEMEGRLTSARHAPVEIQRRARAELVALAGRIAHAAVAAGGGSSNRMTHDAQRVYREVLMFTVLGQTGEVRDTTVDILTREGIDH